MATRPIAAAASPAIELRGISKRFGAVHANRDVTLSVPKGVIHGIVGENGAGKSTLMSILYGFYEADEGEILVDGTVRRITSSSDAIAAGIGMVHQHFMLVGPFSVVENVMLGAEGGPVLAKGRRQVRAELLRLESEYHLEVPPSARVRDLAVGLRQRVEILKALYRRAEVLILDEPTGALTPAEADHLFRILFSLRDQGKTVLLITHKLREIMAVTDSVSVMRQGRLVASLATRDSSQEELAELMVGRRMAQPKRPPRAAPGDVLLEARGLDFIDALGVRRLKDVSLTVRAGEILGVAGVSGNGQTELLAILSGMMRATGGEVLVKQCPLSTVRDVNARTLRRMGVGHIPEDRHRDGLVMQFEASESAILGHHDDAAYNGRVLTDRAGIVRHGTELMRDCDVRPPDPLLKSANFSGGNQQKLIVGREVERNPDILLIGQPTRGVDIGAIEQIHRRITDLRNAGKAIVLVSVELDEIRALSDRIVVLFDGAIVGELDGEAADERSLGLMMAGVRPH